MRRADDCTTRAARCSTPTVRDASMQTRRSGCDCGGHDLVDEKLHVDEEPGRGSGNGTCGGDSSRTGGGSGGEGSQHPEGAGDREEQCQHTRRSSARCAAFEPGSGCTTAACAREPTTAESSRSTAVQTREPTTAESSRSTAVQTTACTAAPGSASICITEGSRGPSAPCAPPAKSAGMAGVPIAHTRRLARTPRTVACMTRAHSTCARRRAQTARSRDMSMSAKWRRAMMRRTAVCTLRAAAALAW